MASAATSVSGITFSDTEGNVVIICQADLDKYCDSFLSILSRNRQVEIGTSDCPVQVPFSGNTLVMVAEFYETGIWKNPGIYENKLSIVGVIGPFDDICEFLGLPSDNIQCDDDDDAPSAWDEMSPEEQQEWRNAQAAVEWQRKMEDDDDHFDDHFDDDRNGGCDVCGSPFCTRH